MTTEMHVEIDWLTAAEWLVKHYESVPGIWEQFDLDHAALSLTDNALDLKLTSYDGLPTLDLMCIMADSRM